jgi:chromosome segregation ATPase
LAAAKADLAAYRAEIATIRSEIALLRVSIDTFEEQISELYQFAATSEAELQDAHEDIDELKTKLNRLNSSPDTEESDLDQAVPSD